MLDLIHLVELAFKKHEVTTSLRFFIDHVYFEFLKSVYNLEEVTMVKEKAEITLLSLFYDLLDWERKSVLIKVVLEFGSLIFL